MKKDDIKSIIISRSDAIGDVILSLPLVGLLKKQKPELKIYFLAKNYTKDIILSCNNVDAFISLDELMQLDKNDAIEELKKYKADAILHVFPKKEVASLAKASEIPLRIGTKSRWYHWFTCNSLISLRRKKSEKHEAELNIALAYKAGLVTTLPAKENLHKLYNLKINSFCPSDINLDQARKKVILHPGSNLSARNWPIEYFSQLAEKLKTNYQVFISGTEEEGKSFRSHFNFNDNLVDLSGKMTLLELMSFIQNTDVLVAASTGPLHIAAALDKHAIGLYPPIRPMHPQRWAPLGKHASYLVHTLKDCVKCKNANDCPCMKSIAVEQVYQKILALD